MMVFLKILFLLTISIVCLIGYVMEHRRKHDVDLYSFLAMIVASLIPIFNVIILLCAWGNDIGEFLGGNKVVFKRRPK